MIDRPEGAPLNAATQIGLIGDILGDLGALADVSEHMAARGVRTLLAVGDVGFLRDARYGPDAVGDVSEILALRGQSLFWAKVGEGELELLSQVPADEDGVHRMASDISYLPPGYRVTLASGRTLAAFGSGGFGSDSAHGAARSEFADVLVGGEAPYDVLALEAERRAIDTDAQAEKALGDRGMFHQAFLRTRPALCLGSGYDQYLDEVAGYLARDVAGDRAFATRVVLLDSIHDARSASTAILDVATLDLAYFTSGGVELPSDRMQVTDLTTEASGRWLVHTIASQYIVDLDVGTIERLPGPTAPSTINDRVRQIEVLRSCRIGERGRWTMRADRFDIDHYWQVSSVIRHIEPIAIGHE